MKCMTGGTIAIRTSRVKSKEQFTLAQSGSKYGIRLYLNAASMGIFDIWDVTSVPKANLFD